MRNSNLVQTIANSIVFALVIAIVVVVGENIQSFGMNFIVALGLTLGVQAVGVMKKKSSQQSGETGITLQKLDCIFAEPKAEVQEPETSLHASGVAGSVAPELERQEQSTDEHGEAEATVVEAEVKSEELVVAEEVQTEADTTETAAVKEATLLEIPSPVQVSANQENLDIDAWGIETEEVQAMLSIMDASQLVPPVDQQQPVTSDVVEKAQAEPKTAEVVKIEPATTAIASQVEISADEGQDVVGNEPVLDVEVNEAEVAIVSTTGMDEEPAVLETLPVTQEEQLEPAVGSVELGEDSGEILTERQILEALKGLSTAKAWHKIYDRLADKYQLAAQDRKTSSQQSRAQVLWQHRVRKNDLEVARKAALSFLATQTKKAGSRGKTKAS
jgi:hypothetical protein